MDILGIGGTVALGVAGNVATRGYDRAMRRIFPQRACVLERTVLVAFQRAMSELDKQSRTDAERLIWNQLHIAAESLFPIGSEAFPLDVLSALVRAEGAELSEALAPLVTAYLRDSPEPIHGNISRLVNAFSHAWTQVIQEEEHAEAFREFQRIIAQETRLEILSELEHLSREHQQAFAEIMTRLEAIALGSIPPPDVSADYNKLSDQIWGAADSVISVLNEVKQDVRRAFEQPDNVSEVRGQIPDHALVNLRLDEDFLFIGRDPELAQLHGILEKHGYAYITGMPGVGKTQTALRYAMEYRLEYRAVFWADADTPTTLLADFDRFAQQLGVPHLDEKGNNVALISVHRWMSEQAGWLLVLDNADDPSVVREFLPPGDRGKLIYTSRRDSLGTQTTRVEVKEMRPEDGAKLLLRRADLLQEDQVLDQVVQPEIHQAAMDVATLLGGLPLAIDQAGAYLKETGETAAEYRDRYPERLHDRLDRRGANPAGHPDAVLTTFWLAFDELEAKGGAAADLLRMCAFLEPDNIPEELFLNGVEALTPRLQAAIRLAGGWSDIIGALRSLSLARWDENKRFLSVHRLTRDVLLSVMDLGERKESAEHAVEAVGRAFPDIGFSTWVSCDRLLPHARLCIEHIRQHMIESPVALRMLNQSGTYLQSIGKLTEAEALLEMAFILRQKVLGEEHSDTLVSMNNLAFTYRSRGRYDDAKPLFQQSYEARKRLLGREHPATLTSMANLASLYESMGQNAEAELLYQDALKMSTMVLGTEHAITLSCMNNLAGLFESQGRYSSAEPLYNQAFIVRKRVFGEAHPDTLTSMNNLAHLFQSQGLLPKAESLFRRVLIVRKRVLGTEHPATLTSMNNLAGIWQRRGQISRAERLIGEMLATSIRVLGEEHPNTLAGMYNLAHILRLQGRFTEAEPLCERAFIGAEKTLGSAHPSTVGYCMTWLNLLVLLGQKDKGKPVFMRMRQYLVSRDGESFDV